MAKELNKIYLLKEKKKSKGTTKNRKFRCVDKTRPILVKFASFENRDFVKKNANNLKGSSYGISEQPPAEIMNIRKVKLPILKELRDRDVKAYFVKDTLFVGGKEYIP